MDLLAAINEFASGNPENATVVTDRLRSFLWRYLAGFVREAADREDVSSEVIARLWGRRGNLVFPTLGAFWAYVAKTARSVALNRARSHLPVEQLDEELSAADVEFLDTIAEASEDRERLYALADEVWLGVSGQAGRRENQARLLAAQLFFLHQRSVIEIAELLFEPGEEAVNRIGQWLSDESLLLALCFDQLYFENDKLAAHVLDPMHPASASALDEATRHVLCEDASSPFLDWTPLEVRLLLLRYRNGLLAEKILQLVPAVTREELQVLFDRSELLAPFKSIASRLKASIMANGATTEPLKSPGLYKRLVFQYHAADELPHRQILERTCPVAEVGTFSLTEGMLNVWLSNGRLFTQLAAQAKGIG